MLTSFSFTAANFARVFDGAEFWHVLGVTMFYTVFGTLGALVMGLFAALLLDNSFRGQGILRGLYLFPTSPRSSRWRSPGSCCSTRSPARSTPC